jgi:putative transposase
VYHVLNRRVERLPLFDKPGDYAAFEAILADAYARTRMCLTAYDPKPTHRHLLRVKKKGCQQLFGDIFLGRPG